MMKLQFRVMKQVILSLKENKMCIRDSPFVVGGGPCVYNAEPVADFFDFFVIGEGEEVDVYKRQILRRVKRIFMLLIN